MTRPALRFVEHIAAAMDTTIAVQIGEPSRSSATDAALLARARGAFRWFEEVEATCSRFDPDSELSQLCRAAGTPSTAVPVSALLFDVLRLALAVADASHGAFDPTLGDALHASGFDRHWRTGERIECTNRPSTRSGGWRDVTLDVHARTVTFAHPLTLDLGGIAKGFAIDLAARELADLPHIAINAGGDIFARGHNPHGHPWRIGIRDPHHPGRLAATLAVSDAAVCTSGIDQRRQPNGQHHLLDPATRRSADTVASMTVVAPLAVMADALATAAFVLPPVERHALLEREQVQGLYIDHDGRLVTAGCAVAGACLMTDDDPTIDTTRAAGHAVG